MLGPLADLGQFQGGPLESEGEGHGELEGGAGGQPATDGQGRGHGPAESGARSDFGHDARDVAGPSRPDRRRVLDVEGDHGGLGLIGGGQGDGVAARFALDGRLEVDGHGQHQPTEVVGVVPDQVHPPRSARPDHLEWPVRCAPGRGPPHELAPRSEWSGIA